MNSALPYMLLADGILIVHIAAVFFVTGGLAFIFAGNLLTWQWVNSIWFRIAHLATTAFIAVETWLGIDCPLTTLENWLREQEGAAVYSGRFTEYWLRHLLFFEAPTWVFVSVPTLICLLAIAAWWYFPPKTGQLRRDQGR